MQVLDRAFDIARKKNYKIVFPENDDERIVEAANFLSKENLAEIIWIDNLKLSSENISTILKNRPGIKKSIAEKLIKKPLYFAGSILATGQADALVAGASNSTKRVIEAASLTVGVSEGIVNISSYFLMISPDNKEYIFSDCAVNTFINEEILEDIAINASKAAEKLLGFSQIALLSFSTLASGEGDSVKMVRSVSESLNKKGIKVYGPIQGDAAVVNSIAKLKGINYEGDLNVFIFSSPMYSAINPQCDKSPILSKQKTSMI